ncbi:MAG: hypothetical protein IPJ65_33910 [Archangiaceae bacterium]|nr:hypothetical protein [Archangiaceae bacterium]
MRKQLTFWSLALGVALAAYLFARDASPAKVAATGAPAPVQVAVTPVVEPMPKTEPAAEPAPLPGVTFQAGFCSDGEAESFTTRATLSNLLQTLEPSDPAHTEVQAALEARTQNDFEGELAAVRRARRLLPRDPALGWAIARLTRESASLDEAIEGLTVFLAVQSVPSLSRLRARLEVARDIQQDYRREQRGGVTLLWPAAALDNGQVHDLALEVDRALDDAARLIGKPRRPRLTVVVYPSRSELLAVTCAAAWSAAVYDGTLAGGGGQRRRRPAHGAARDPARAAHAQRADRAEVVSRGRGAVVREAERAHPHLVADGEEPHLAALHLARRQLPGVRRQRRRAGLRPELRDGRADARAGR